MLGFSRLSPGQQKKFLDSLNLYMFASPQQRHRFRQSWTVRTEGRARNRQ